MDKDSQLVEIHTNCFGSYLYGSIVMRILLFLGACFVNWSIVVAGPKASQPSRQYSTAQLRALRHVVTKRHRELRSLPGLGRVLKSVKQVQPSSAQSK
jgi:hypothetical protein